MRYGLGFGLSIMRGGSSPPPIPATLFANGEWASPYSASVATVSADGSTATGVPYGLTATVSGGVLTVSGVPL